MMNKSAQGLLFLNAGHFCVVTDRQTAHRDSMSSTSKTTNDPVRFSTELWVSLEMENADRIGRLLHFRT